MTTKPKKALVITASSTYKSRAEAVSKYLQKRGWETRIILPDFDHQAKEKRKQVQEGVQYLPMHPYKKNLSAARLYALSAFAKEAVKAANEQEPALLYVMLPANSLGRAFSAYQTYHPTCRLVFDILDLWPESLPIRYGKRLWPFSAWQALRDKALPKADLIITECALFAKCLQEEKRIVPQISPAVVYWPNEIARPAWLKLKERDVQSKSAGMAAAKNMTENPFLPKSVQKESLKQEANLHVCYLGAINHIIDIKGIAKLLGALQKRLPVICHIIGTGENTARFSEALRAVQVCVVEEGAVYEAKQKQNIMRQCSFGLNMMKDTVCVGLTMKSVEYLACGLPLLNSIPGDTWELVEREGVGINIPAVWRSERQAEKQKSRLRKKALEKLAAQGEKACKERETGQANETGKGNRADKVRAINRIAQAGEGEKSEEELLNRILQMAASGMALRRKARLIYEQNFSEKAFAKQMDAAFSGWEREQI